MHLSGGNEAQLVRVFERHVGPEDWALCTWRSHIHCLLKGVPPEDVLKAIVERKSIALCFPEHRVLSSAIVGGTAPIAVGLALAIKRKGEQRKVVCFLGDMAWETGGVQEAVKYARNHRLPVLWVLEDNAYGVGARTADAWGGLTRSRDVIRYQYSNAYPHCGIGEQVHF